MSESKLLVKTSNGLFLLKKDFNQESSWRSDDCYKFIYSVNGTMAYQTNRSQITIDEQQFVFFNPHDEHKQLAVDKRKFLIEIEPSFLNRTAKSLSPIHYDIQFASCTQRYPQLTKWVQFVIEYVQLEKDDLTESLELFLDHSFTQLALILVKYSIGTQTHDINLNTYKTIHSQLYKSMAGNERKLSVYLDFR